MDQICSEYASYVASNLIKILGDLGPIFLRSFGHAGLDIGAQNSVVWNWG